MPKLFQTCPLRRATDGDNCNQGFPATDLASFNLTLLKDLNAADNHVNGGGGGGADDEPIDFVLAWDGRDEVASTAEATDKRRVFEGNLGSVQQSSLSSQFEFQCCNLPPLRKILNFLSI